MKHLSNICRHHSEAVKELSLNKMHVFGKSTHVQDRPVHLKDSGLAAKGHTEIDCTLYEGIGQRRENESPTALPFLSLLLNKGSVSVSAPLFHRTVIDLHIPVTKHFAQDKPPRRRKLPVTAENDYLLSLFRPYDP